MGGNLENGFVASLPLDAAQELGPECAIGTRFLASTLSRVFVYAGHATPVVTKVLYPGALRDLKHIIRLVNAGTLEKRWLEHAGV